MKLFITMTVTLAILIMTTLANAQDVTLQWDANQDADYYIVYWGDTAGDYTIGKSEPIKDSLTYTVTNLDSKRYFFSVKAFNYCGNSSDFSEPVSNCDAWKTITPMTKPHIVIIKDADGRVIVEIN